MAFILFRNAGRMAALDALFASGAMTADVVFARELRNRRGMGALTWLHKAEVLTGTDAALVNTLLRTWNSDPGKDKGEAEIIALGERYGWLAITDDKQGRAELERRDLPYCYVVTCLVYAAAIGHAGHTNDSAWDLSEAIQVDRRKPYIGDRAKFDQLVVVARARWEQRGRPLWPQVLADWKIDHLIDRSDGRHPVRPRRSS